jgi:serine/threonine protein phosphatase PrpC
MIPTENSEFAVFAATHAGKGGEKNEDRYRLETFLLDEDKDKESLFAIIADGIGAHQAGEVAAEIAVEAVSKAIAQSDASQPTGILEAAIVQASQAIRFRSESRPEWEGMGSTCLCVWLIGNQLFTASVGNSRLYLVRNNQIHQLNVIRRLPGKVSQPLRSKKRGPNEDALGGYLGSKSPVEVDFRLVDPSNNRTSSRLQGLQLQPNDKLLICSDGLGDSLTPPEILEFFGKKDSKGVADELVNFALMKGTNQNVTAVIVGMPSISRFAQPVNWLRSVAIALLIVLMIFIGLFSWWMWLGQLDTIRTSPSTAISTLTPVSTNTPVP